MTPVDLSACAGQAFANAEKLKEWIGKTALMVSSLERCGEDTQECVGLAEQLGDNLTRAYETCLDLALKIGSTLRARSSSGSAGPDNDSAA